MRAFVTALCSQGGVPCDRPYGLGKTTTLYACLRMLNTVDTKILTAEDPVESRWKALQCHIVEAMGMTFQGTQIVFASGPDIILVGEMRDLETAEWALKRH